MQPHRWPTPLSGCHNARFAVPNGLFYHARRPISYGKTASVAMCSQPGYWHGDPQGDVAFTKTPGKRAHTDIETWPGSKQPTTDSAPGRPTCHPGALHCAGRKHFPASATEAVEQFYNGKDFALFEHLVARNAQFPGMYLLCYRQAHASPLFIALLPVGRYRIVNHGLDTVFCQILLQFVAPLLVERYLFRAPVSKRTALTRRTPAHEAETF